MGFSWANLASQKRSTCFGTSSSSATSLMVRNASGALSNARPPYSRQTAGDLLGCLSSRQRVVDPLFHDVACTKHQHAPRRDGNFLAGLWIAANALALVANAERAARRQLNRVAALEARHDLAHHQLNDLRGLVPRQTDLLKHCFRQIGARKCLPAHMPTLPQSRD